MSKPRRRKPGQTQTPSRRPPRHGRRWLYAAGGAVVVAVGLVLAVALGVGGKGATTARAPGAPIDGTQCQAEMVQIHFHAHLALIQSGTAIPLPGGIGILQDQGCLYWLHTHAADGIIHIESPGAATFTLGVFVDGISYAGDPRAIALTAHELITIESGGEVPPPAFTFPDGY